jgi:hypothetical protein
MKYFKKPNYNLCKWDLFNWLWYGFLPLGLALQFVTLGWFRYINMGEDIAEEIYKDELRRELERGN